MQWKPGQSRKPKAPRRFVHNGARDRWLPGERGQEKKAGFVGMDRFGASAPAGELFQRFGITAEGTVAKVKELLG